MEDEVIDEEKEEEDGLVIASHKFGGGVRPRAHSNQIGNNKISKLRGSVQYSIKPPKFKTRNSSFAPKVRSIKEFEKVEPRSLSKMPVNGLESPKNKKNE